MYYQDIEHLPEIWCCIITYVKLHNVVGVTLNYNKNVIIYMNIQMSIAIVPDIKANVQWYFR